MLDALLERGPQLERVQNLITDARDGRGECLAVIGPAGIGKTALLDAAIEMARAAGVRVGRAVGGLLERDHPFGAARDLFADVLRSLPPEAKATLFDGAAASAALLLGLSPATNGIQHRDIGALLHALYWLVANVAESGPVMIVVDDAHWIDAPTLRFLSYLARRLDGLPVALVVASRPAGTGAEGELLDALLADPTVDRVELSGLSSEAVATLVRDGLDAAADAAFCDACGVAGGGNPFLTLELLRGLQAADVAPVAAEAASVVDVGGARAGAAIRQRLHGLPPEATELARAVAVLGHDASFAFAANLTSMEVALAARMADLLTRSDVFAGADPLRFAHPLLAAAIYDGIPPATRSQAHRRAARLLDEAGLDANRPAAHLLAAAPAADPWASSVLLDAGCQAMATGAPESAARFLGRALVEPPSSEQRLRALWALGDAERAMNWSTSVDHLRQALPLASTAREVLDIVLLLRSALVEQGRFAEAVTALEEVMAVTVDRQQRMRLETAIVQTALSDSNLFVLVGQHFAQLRAYLSETGDVPADVLGVGSMALALLGEPAARVAGLAYEALIRQKQQVTRPVAPWCGVPLWVMVMCEHPEAEPMLTWCAAQAGRQGEVLQQGQALLNRGWERLRRGDLAGAEIDARTSLEIFSLSRVGPLLPESVAILAQVLLERGEPEQAARLLARHQFEGPLPGGDLSSPFVIRVRGLLRLAQGLTRDAVSDLRECGIRCEAFQALPGFLPWRSELAMALAATGDTASANALAAREVELARAFGAPRALGIALRGLGVVTRSDAVLASAVEVLEEANGALELGRALVDLGALARRDNDRSRARELLARGLDLATRCGSVVLDQRVRVELNLAGARPRRTAVFGRDSLTASELRVAVLAAEGRTNKDIAQTSFVSLKTVETQLAATYRKLGIGAELAVALTA